MCNTMACLEVFQEVGNLLVREVAVFRLIPQGIQQAPNVYPICLVSRLAVLFATLEERRIIITSEQYVGVQ